MTINTVDNHEQVHQAGLAMTAAMTGTAESIAADIAECDQDIAELLAAVAEPTDDRELRAVQRDQLHRSKLWRDGLAAAANPAVLAAVVRAAESGMRVAKVLAAAPNPDSIGAVFLTVSCPTRCGANVSRRAHRRGDPGRHFHGGLVVEAPNFGHRAPHCATGEAGGYVLVDIDGLVDPMSTGHDRVTS